MAKLHLHLPNRPEGEEVQVSHFGLFKNGGTYEVPALTEDLYIPPRVVDAVPGPKTNHVDDIMSWVGDDPERAAQALANEPEPKRRTLVDKLTKILAQEDSNE